VVVVTEHAPDGVTRTAEPAAIKVGRHRPAAVCEPQVRTRVEAVGSHRTVSYVLGANFCSMPTRLRGGPLARRVPSKVKIPHP